MRKIKSIEIELPYRYRGYEVGKPIMYDVQNAAYVGGYDYSVKVEKIIDGYVFNEDKYIVKLSNGDSIEIHNNQPGIIITDKKVSE